jgi:hypothetical protein
VGGRARTAAGWLELTLAGPALVQALAAAARLGIFDLVRDQPRSALLLASTAGVHPEGLTRLLRALAAAGVLAPTGDGRFGPTPVSDLLCRDARGPHRERLLALANLEWEGWAGLLQAVETGRPARAQPGADEDIPPGAAAGVLRRALGGAAPATVFGGERFRAWLAAAIPAATGAAGPPACAAGGGLSARDDAGALAELAAVHAALPPGGRVLLVEPVLSADPAASLDLALRDLRRLALGAGRYRTAEEWQRLLERAGLRLEGMQPVRGAGGWAVLTASRGLV